MWSPDGTRIAYLDAQSVFGPDDAAFGAILEGDLATVAVPTLVIAAGDDLLTPGAEAIAAEIPGAKLVVAEGAGHAVAMEAPDAVNEALASQLG